MSPTEQLIYEYLVAYNSIYHKMPSVKELAYQFDRDVSVITKHIRSLVEQGKIERLIEPIWYRLRE